MLKLIKNTVKVKIAEFTESDFSNEVISIIHNFGKVYSDKTILNEDLYDLDVVLTKLNALPKKEVLKFSKDTYQFILKMKDELDSIDITYIRFVSL